MTTIGTSAAFPPALPGLDLTSLRETRAQNPAAIAHALATRTRRPLLGDDGRLFIVAADHPARGALAAGSSRNAMADREELLRRLAAALARPGVDGVLGTPDVIDDLALLGLLENKVVVGSMNRGGLRGSAFEMDDRYTAFTIDRIVRDRVDVAKNLVRINLSDPASVATLEATARAVNEAADAHVPIMLEPFMSEWVDGRIRNDLSTEAVILSIAIASGLGHSSAYSWLKLPVVEDMERVMAATTLPTLLLGGEVADDQDQAFEQWSNALSLPNVRGLVVGRSLLYPADDDVVAAVDMAAALVHG
ncbi:MAG: deoxyribose-phosphate aldolase [Yonghaparkia sp.]|nr:deoxyribose-phosphate aldolase [Microcella sp.]